MAFIKGQHVADSISMGEHDQRRIGETERERSVAADDPLGSGDVIGFECLHPIHPAADLSQEGSLSSLPNARRKQIVELRQHER